MHSIKAKKNVKYSICSCGLSKKLPYCDNAHRKFNENHNTNYKSVKINLSDDIKIDLECSNWNNNE
tara:strand:+ start:1447 stop:1644 length:198 start_codon:yes stop_codon:yes gene_type:complete